MADHVPRGTVADWHVRWGMFYFELGALVGALIVMFDK